MSKLTTQNRRSTRVETRKTQILDAAAKLFAANGFHCTTTKDIAFAAGVSEGTLYNYFKCKDDLLFEIITRLSEAQHLDEQLGQSFPHEAKEFFLALLHYRKQYLQENKSMIQSVFSEILVNPILRNRYYEELVLPAINLVEEHLHARNRLGQLRPINPSAAARVIFGLTLGLYLLEVLGDSFVETEWQLLAEATAMIFFDGIILRSE